MRSTVSTCPHVGARCYLPMPRGNWRRSCLMAHNEDNDPIDDDDQHVHHGSPTTPSYSSSTLDQSSSSHPVNTVYGRW
jgi:hypothetical protein